MLEAFGVERSLSAEGCPHDNAVDESADGIPRARLSDVSVNLFFTSFAKQARRSRKGGFIGCANVLSPIPVTA